MPTSASWCARPNATPCIRKCKVVSACACPRSFSVRTLYLLVGGCPLSRQSTLDNASERIAPSGSYRCGTYAQHVCLCLHLVCAYTTRSSLITLLLIRAELKSGPLPSKKAV
jgi:hypothetical protein